MQTQDCLLTGTKAKILTSVTQYALYKTHVNFHQKCKSYFIVTTLKVLFLFFNCKTLIIFILMFFFQSAHDIFIKIQRYKHQ